MSRKIEHIIFVLSYVFDATAQGSNYSISDLRKKATKERASKFFIDPKSVHDAFTNQLKPQKQAVTYFDSILLEWIERKNIIPLRNLLVSQIASGMDKEMIETFIFKYSIND